jgi:hypothetical protein
MAWNWKCKVSVGKMESAPGGVDEVLLLLGCGGNLSDEAIGYWPRLAPGKVSWVIDAEERGSDRPSELVRECVREWLGVLGLYYGNRLDKYQYVWKRLLMYRFEFRVSSPRFY